MSRRMRTWSLPKILGICLPVFIFYNGYMMCKSNLGSESLHEIVTLEQEHKLPLGVIANWSSLEKISCKIPHLYPNDPLTLYLDEKQFQNEGKNGPPPCVNNNSTKFYIDLNSNLIRLNPDDEFWRNSNCSYQSYTRHRDLPTIGYQFGRVQKIVQDYTPLNSEFENIVILCHKIVDPILNESLKGHKVVYIDRLFHVPVISESDLPGEFRQDFGHSKNSTYSVVILGIDSVSRMSFIRHWSKSYKFLVNNLSAFDFKGYNTFGHYSWTNILPLLTGLLITEVKSECGWETWKPIDNCPFLWSKFRDHGYVTSYIDEAPQQMFPFSKKPVDFDFRDVYYTGKNQPVIGHNVLNNSLPCFGSRLAFQGQLDLISKFIYRARFVPHFQFTWTYTLAHDVNQYGQYGDDLLLAFLGQMVELKLMEETIFIILGDHGARHGDLREFSEQGFLEERLPIFLMTLPQKFRQVWPLAIQNLQDYLDKYVTVLDIYKTILDVLDMSKVNYDSTRVSKEQEKLRQRGQSLWTRLPNDRNCVEGQMPTYCICPERRTLSLKNKIILEAAQFILNKIINVKVSTSELCAQLEFTGITQAYERPTDNSYEISFTTKPGNGHFYTHVKWDEEGSSWVNLFLTRISEFSQFCVGWEIQEFCHCKKSNS